MLGEVNRAIVEKYAYLIYKEALLESGSVELVTDITAAVKPVNQIKPKRALIVLLATMLSGILAVFIVFYHIII